VKYDTPKFDIPYAYKDRLCQNCIYVPTAKRSMNYSDVGKPCEACWGASLRAECDRPNFERPPIPFEELM
jgi:hypothetical protein